MVPATDGLVDVRSVGVRTQVVVAREDQDVDDALSLPQSSLSTVSASTDVVALIPPGGASASIFLRFPYRMVKCVVCQESASDKCLRVGKLCGKCCQPRCCEGAHNNRWGLRGKRGHVAKEHKWNRVWRLTNQCIARMSKHVPFRRYLEHTRISPGAVRYALRQTMHKMLERHEREDVDVPDEVAVSMYPADLDAALASLQTDSSASDCGMGAETLPQSIADIVAESLGESVGDAEAVHTKRFKVHHGRMSGASDGSHAVEDAELCSPPSSYRPSARSGTATVQVHNPMGLRAVDLHGEPCSHYRRIHPPLQRLTYEHEKMAHPFVHGTSLYEDADEMLAAWLKRRQGLLDRFVYVKQKEYLWAPRAGETQAQMSELHAAGKYYYCPLKEWVPPARTDIETGAMHSTMHQASLNLAMHAGSMYTVHSMIEKGLEANYDERPRSSTGVWAHSPFGYERAIQNSGYAVYSSIGGGFLASPRFELAVDLCRGRQANVDGKSNVLGQLCLQPGTYHLRGVWFHILARADLERGPSTCCLWDDWYPEYEIPA